VKVNLAQKHIELHFGL